MKKHLIYLVLAFFSLSLFTLEAQNIPKITAQHSGGVIWKDGSNDCDDPTDYELFGQTVVYKNYCLDKFREWNGYLWRDFGSSGGGSALLEIYSESGTLADGDGIATIGDNKGGLFYSQDTYHPTNNPDGGSATMVKGNVVSVNGDNRIDFSTSDGTNYNFHIPIIGKGGVPRYGTLDFTNIEDIQTYSFPPKSGIIALLSDITGGATLSGRLITFSDAQTIYVPTASTGLESLNEGNGVGYRFIGTDPSLYGNVGLSSVDMTLPDPYGGDPADMGVSAEASFSAGTGNKITGGGYSNTIGSANIISSSLQGNTAIGMFNKIQEGYGNTIIGVYNESNTSGNGFSSLFGMNNRASGTAPGGAIGIALDVRARNHFAVGASNTIFTGNSNGEDRPIFTVGNGTYTTPTGAWNSIIRSDAFVVKYDGIIEAPSLTIAAIENGVGRTLITKEYLSDQIASIPTSAPLETYVEDMDNNGHFSVVIGDHEDTTTGTKISLSASEETVAVDADSGLLTKKLIVSPNLSATNPFNATISHDAGTVTSSGSDFLIYNAINKNNTVDAPSSNVYGISNLIQHNGSGSLGQIRGAFNRVRLRGTKAPGEITGIFNEVSFQSPAENVISLMSGMETRVVIDDYNISGSIENVLGTRSNVVMDNSFTTIDNGYSIFGSLQMKQGEVSNYSILGLVADQTNPANSEWINGAYLQIKSGIDIAQAQGNNIKAIESQVDLPSTFAGSIESKSFIKTSGTADDVLLGDGSTTSLAGIGGDVYKVGTPVDSQIGIWTGDGTIEGDSGIVVRNGSAIKGVDLGINATSAGFLRLFGHSNDGANAGIQIYANDNRNDNVDYWSIFALGPSGKSNFRIASNISDAFVIDDELLAITAPNTTISDINTLGDKALITKEYVDSEVINIVTTSYTFTIDDADNILTFKNTSLTEAIIPNNVDVSFRIGTKIDVINLNNDDITIDAVSSVTLSSALSFGLRQYEKRTLIKIDTDTWVLTY